MVIILREFGLVRRKVGIVVWLRFGINVNLRIWMIFSCWVCVIFRLFLSVCVILCVLVLLRNLILIILLS